MKLDTIIYPACISDLYAERELKTLEVNPICGIYFLVLDNKVVYVGKSTNIEYRIKSHKDKVFDTVLYFEASKDKLTDLEDYYIIAFNPKYNNTHEWYHTLNKHRIASCNKPKKYLKKISITVKGDIINKMHTIMKHQKIKSTSEFLWLAVVEKCRRDIKRCKDE